MRVDFTSFEIAFQKLKISHDKLLLILDSLWKLA